MLDGERAGDASRGRLARLVDRLASPISTRRWRLHGGAPAAPRSLIPARLPHPGRPHDSVALAGPRAQDATPACAGAPAASSSGLVESPAPRSAFSRHFIDAEAHHDASCRSSAHVMEERWSPSRRGCFPDTRCGGPCRCSGRRRRYRVTFTGHERRAGDHGRQLLWRCPATTRRRRLSISSSARRSPTRNFLNHNNHDARSRGSMTPLR